MRSLQRPYVERSERTDSPICHDEFAFNSVDSLSRVRLSESCIVAPKCENPLFEFALLGIFR